MDRFTVLLAATVLLLSTVSTQVDIGLFPAQPSKDPGGQPHPHPPNYPVPEEDILELSRRKRHGEVPDLKLVEKEQEKQMLWDDFRERHESQNEGDEMIRLKKHVYNGKTYEMKEFQNEDTVDAVDAVFRGTLFGLLKDTKVARK